MTEWHPFEQRLSAGWPPDWRQVGVVLAVSGGADSVALLRATARLRGGRSGLTVANFDHGLRGAESQRDQQFVAALAAQLGLDCKLGQATADSASQSSDQAEAGSRAARYEFLQRTAEQAGARYLATAHTADDQAETILHHILRGTGLAGLAGIPRVRSLGAAVTVVRPMLELSRADVLEYLAQLGQPYCEDRTNRDLKFMRNRIRHELLPLLSREYAAASAESLVRLGRLAADAQAVIEADAAHALARSLVHADDDGVTLDCGKLSGEHRHVVREILLGVWRQQQWPLAAMGFEQWNSLADMALAPHTATPARQVFPGAVTAERQGNHLLLAARKPRQA